MVSWQAWMEKSLFKQWYTLAIENSQRTSVGLQLMSFPDSLWVLCWPLLVWMLTPVQYTVFFILVDSLHNDLSWCYNNVLYLSPSFSFLMCPRPYFKWKTFRTLFFLHNWGTQCVFQSAAMWLPKSLIYFLLYADTRERGEKQSSL